MGASKDRRTPPDGPERPGVSELAAHALDLLATRRNASQADRWIEALAQAVSMGGPDERDRVVSQMRGAGLSNARICDHYIPTVARLLGDRWCNDAMSFAEVTIGSARLQSLLRDLSEEVEDGARDERQQVVVMVLADEYHTLGAMVLTDQLRRQGASVRLMLGRPAEEVAELIGSGRYDSVLISVALCDDLSRPRRMIETLRKMGARVPMIVGGGILELGAEAVRDATGADHVTNDPVEALRYSGARTQAGLSP